MARKKPSKKENVIVIGAGPTGLTAAYQLAKAGLPVDVYEAAPQVGGLARSIELWGQRVDLGPHRFFSDDTRVNEFWLEVVGDDYRMVDRLTRIFYRNKFYHYPIKAFDALMKLGIWESSLSVLSYIKEKFFPTPEEDTFEWWVTNRFGNRLFHHFFKSYSEKLWGITCKELDADFAAQRIKKFSLSEAIKSAFSLGKGKHKTLVEQFAYPLRGTGMVYENMAEFIKKHGGKVHLDTPIKGVLTKNNKAIGVELMNGTKKKADHVVSTMPMTLMVRSLPDVPGKIKKLTEKLTFRNTILIYLHIDGKDLFPDNWLYVHSPELKMGRVTNFRNWVPELYGDKETTILVLELWANDDDKLWNMSDEKLIEIGKKDIKKTGLINNKKILDGHVFKIHRCYPVYQRGYKKILKPIEKYLDTIENLHVIGRYGAFKYNNQDHSILMGLMAAENIIDNAGHNLWEINTDYETYQEKSVITATGLSDKG